MKILLYPEFIAELENNQFQVGSYPLFGRIYDGLTVCHFISITQSLQNSKLLGTLIIGPNENREPKGYEGVAPCLNAAREPGEWQVFDIIFKAPQFDNDGKKVENAKFSYDYNFSYNNSSNSEFNCRNKYNPNSHDTRFF